ncbi:MAG: NAD-dependent epimerase/dehydratase family protein [Magnetococcales bacterium]|nr:NAD-dependent epimerase/dehydratase family protein [Magnetococcales bacterium]
MTTSDSSYPDLPANILVTGGAGFIGSALVRQLRGAGRRITVVDNLVNGKRENLAGLEAYGVRLEVCDVRNGERMAQLLEGVDLVYHLACLGVRHAIHDPLENQAVNAQASLSLLSLARQAGVQRFVYVSTSEVYGTARHVPMTEAHPTFPMTVYGASKLAGECYARAFYETYGFPTVMVRPFNAFGPRCHHEGDSGEVIPKFMLRQLAGKPLIIFGDGLQTRDFTYVEDSARGILLAGVVPDAVGHTINLGSGREITIRQLAEEVAHVTGREKVEIEHHDPRPADVLRLYADAEAARSLLGFTPTVTLQQGLQSLHDWYAAEGRTPEELLDEEVVHNWRGTAGSAS